MDIKGLDAYLISIAIGVRFRANFSIEDELGAIVDKILYKRGSFFNPNFFPAVLGQASEKVLFNDKTQDKLVINNSNIILEYNLQENSAEQIDQLCNHFDEQIINGIMREYKVTQINRVGYINRYLFLESSLANSFLDKTIGKTLEGINDINLQFSRKYPVMESLAKENTNDYNNAIFNIIKKSNKDELFISVDYQKNFEPFLESSTQIEFKEFLNTVDYYNDKTFMAWLNKNYLEVVDEKV